MDKTKPIRIKSEKISTMPIWGLYQDGERVEFYNRETDNNNGLTKQALIDLLLEKGYTVWH